MQFDVGFSFPSADKYYDLITTQSNEKQTVKLDAFFWIVGFTSLSMATLSSPTNG